MAGNKTEEQKYTLIKKEKEFEIRHYPSATIAMVLSSAKNYKELSSPGFRKLASYIFGGNHEKKQIAMTTPVHMVMNDHQSSMAFVMPSEFHNQSLPAPNDSNIIIKTAPEEYVAAIRFGGYASDESIQKYTEILKTGLIREGISFYGDFRFLGYNPPFQLFGRRNEIIVSVKWEA